MKQWIKLILLTLISIVGTNCGQKQSEQEFEPELIQGPFRWDQAAGQTVKLNLNKHPFTESLLPLLQDFTALTGIKVDYTVLSEEEYRDKIIIDLSSGSGSVDVFMTGPFSIWPYVRAGWLEPLEAYLKNPALTSNEYDLDDFFPALIEANRWNGIPGSANYGKGSQWAIPIQVETYILAYRKDWAEELKLTPPKNYEEYYNFAKAMTRKQNNDQFYGVTARGLGTWPTVTTGFLTGFVSYGCQEFDQNMISRINTPKAIDFTKLWLQTIKECGPFTWSSNTWYDAKEQFESGRYGMILDCDFFAASYENTEKSRVAGKVGYALPPAGPNGTIVSNFWTWALSVNKQSRNKLASWLFIQWATSKEQLLSAAFNGNWNPVRYSVWNDPQVVEIVENWANYREVVETNLQKHVKVCWVPQPEFSAVGDRWARALQEIWTGTETKAALDNAANDINRIIENAGIRKLLR